MSRTDDGSRGNRTGFVSRMLLKAFGPAEITPADDEDRRAQQAHRDHQEHGPEHPHKA